MLVYVFGCALRDKMFDFCDLRKERMPLPPAFDILIMKNTGGVDLVHTLVHMYVIMSVRLWNFKMVGP